MSDNPEQFELEKVTGAPTPAELKNMGNLWTMKKAAQDAYNEAAKGLATKYEMNAEEIKKYVDATEQDKLSELQAKLDTRQTLLDLDFKRRGEQLVDDLNRFNNSEI